MLRFHVKQFTALAFVIAAFSLAGCAGGAQFIDVAAASTQAKAERVRQVRQAAARAKREAAKRVHCITSTSDLYSLSAIERHNWLVYCGYPIDAPVVFAPANDVTGIRGE